MDEEGKTATKDILGERFLLPPFLLAVSFSLFFSVPERPRDHRAARRCRFDDFGPYALRLRRTESYLGPMLRARRAIFLRIAITLMIDASSGSSSSTCIEKFINNRLPPSRYVMNVACELKAVYVFSVTFSRQEAVRLDTF